MFEKLKYIDADYQIFRQGGSEEGGGSAGMAIISWDRDDRAVRTLVHCEATAWPHERTRIDPSAFEAEVVALDRAVARTLEMLETRALPRRGWERRPLGGAQYCDH